MLVLLQNNELIYPYSVKRLKRDNQNISFPTNLSDDLLNSFNVYNLKDSDKPSYDTKTQKVIPGVELGVPVWQVIDKNVSELSETINRLRFDKQKELTSFFNSLYWKEIPFRLPDDTVVTMQFRNSSDESNIKTVQQAALAISISGGSSTVSFRMKDNNKYNISADHFLQQTLAIFSDKQTLLNIFWEKKNELEDLNTLDGISNFDVEAGW